MDRERESSSGVGTALNTIGCRLFFLSNLIVYSIRIDSSACFPVFGKRFKPIVCDVGAHHRQLYFNRCVGNTKYSVCSVFHVILSVFREKTCVIVTISLQRFCCIASNCAGILTGAQNIIL